MEPTQLRESAPGQCLEPLLLDVRPVFARGDTPCAQINEALANLQPGQTFVLLVPFEPVPLYSKFANLGLGHHAASLPDGSYRIEFRAGLPTDDSHTSGATHSCNCSQPM